MSGSQPIASWSLPQWSLCRLQNPRWCGPHIDVPIPLLKEALDSMGHLRSRNNKRFSVRQPSEPRVEGNAVVFRIHTASEGVVGYAEIVQIRVEEMMLALGGPSPSKNLLRDDNERGGGGVHRWCRMRIAVVDSLEPRRASDILPLASRTRSGWLASPNRSEKAT